MSLLVAMHLMSASLVAEVATALCPVSRRIDFDGQLQLDLQPAELTAGHVWLEELGSQVKIQYGQTVLDINGGPVRYGVLLLDLRAGVSQPLLLLSRSSNASVRIASDCPALGEPGSNWWPRLQQAAASIDSRTSSASDPLEPLIAEAQTAFQQATAAHVQAYRLSVLGHSRAAIDAYLQVEQRWLAAADRSRAGAARLGAAEQAHNAARYDQAIGHAQRAHDLLQQPTDRAFRDRALEMQCLAQQALRNGEMALACFQQVGKAYRDSDNADGLLNALYAIALGEYARGDIPASIRAEDEALALEVRRTLPLPRGRVLLQRARRLVDSGQVAQAIEWYAQAIQLFAQSAEAGKAWEAEALSKLARLYAKLGMADTAYRTIERLLRESAAADDPAQVASLLLTLSHVEEAAERPLAALRWSRESASLFAKVKSQDGAREGRLREAELRLRHDLQASQPSAALDDLESSQLSAIDRSRLILVKSMQMLQSGDAGRSQQLAVGIDPATLDSAQRNLRTAVLARGALAQQDPAAAMQAVVDGIDASAARAAPAGNSGVGWIALRSTASLRPLLVDTWLSLPPDQRSISLLWKQWLATLPASAIRARPTQDTDFSASAAVSREFLYGNRSSRDDAALLSSLGKTELTTDGNHPTAPTLAMLQATLGPSDLLLALASGRNHSLLLRISRDQVFADPLASRQVLLDAALAFNALVQRRNSSSAELEAARRQLEALLFQNLSGPRPRRLLLLLDDVLANIPFVALHWPGDAGPLIAHVPVSWISDVRISGRPAMPLTRNQQRLNVLVASRPQASGEQLPELEGAQLEPDMIRLAMPAAQLGLWQDGKADRQQLLAQLADPGGWLHLASHGWSEPGAFGHAGVWLAGPQPGVDPQFLSWLDVADQPVGADLVVLNACQLAATDVTAVSQGSMSFALAVSAAGARNTVAAFWPVSDAATSIWVPQFYGYMAGRDADASAEALRRAQLALLNSRAYRHPYYWASLGHFQRLDVAPAPP